MRTSEIPFQTLTPLLEAWAGTLLALSLLIWEKSWRLSLLFGIVTLTFRELALSFVLLMMNIALWECRRKEAMWWSLGVLFFLGGLALHAGRVPSYAEPDAPAGAGWLVMGGMALFAGKGTMEPFRHPHG